MKRRELCMNIFGSLGGRLQALNLEQRVHGEKGAQIHSTEIDDCVG